ncbi:uncharacterized protein LOC114932040 [Nylanderia fulva]|uniref:uncharacterized protein LOC114932040 n=1 Tax=Nylanderia fulva TaxID=613905 RepID=UPI0010FADAB4|nr:uncharacterized protein LOC114932040 [Nylanderia fulva]
MCTRRRNKLILCIPRSTKEPIKCRQYMWIIMHIHLELCFISREINKVFSIQMTLEMASYFTFFIELCCKIYGIYLENPDNDENTFQQVLNMDTYVWVIVCTVKLLALNHVCQIICDKANETVAILYKLSNDHSDKDFREQILQFILQIKRREIKFYGMGLFYFGYDLIRKFYTTAATVLVIIIQMNIDFNKYIISFDDVIDEN